MLTNKGRFFERSEFVQLVSSLPKCALPPLPVPAILKPRALWTGKQIFSVLLSVACGKVDGIDLETKNKSFPGLAFPLSCLDPDDNMVVVQRGELLCGRVDKKIVGTGSKENLVHLLLCRRGSKV